ncbi:uncharacterized protein LOC129971935 [Argiope bruennichi]|uniref:uncharacterized protein LOC129971295 n=1 Tax=Argiope bruennichi TaxID=94029 RepID=UPI0024945689|nr:uncharacterized protein LOC129971295 [Argiope bruennichi]XP_055941888.1 uncharacterized protein LOC129971935 [Argiope bruennichi]
MRSGDLLIQTKSKKQADTLSKLTTLGSWPIKVSLHKTLNFSRAVVSEQSLVQHSDTELVEELRSQGVCAARRIHVRRDGRLIPTKHVVLTFETPVLPKFIRAGYLRCNIRPYIPNPLRCYQCQRYGHSRQSCRGKMVCGKCSSLDHETNTCDSEILKCPNCACAHAASSKFCPKWQMEKEILAIKIKNNITFKEARQIVNDRMPKSGVSYSSLLKSKPENTNVGSTQTEELLTKIVCPPLKKLQPLKANVTQTKKLPTKTDYYASKLATPVDTSSSCTSPVAAVALHTDPEVCSNNKPTKELRKKLKSSGITNQLPPDELLSINPSSSDLSEMDMEPSTQLDDVTAGKVKKKSQRKR